MHTTNMADIKDGDEPGSRSSTAFTSISVQSLEDERGTTGEMASPSSSRMSDYSEVSTVLFRTFYPPQGYPEDVLATGYPDNGYPDAGYPTASIYPSEHFPAFRYPQIDVPVSPYPRTPLPEASYLPTSSWSSSYTDTPRSEETCLVVTEDLGLSRDSSEILHPMSAFIHKESSNDTGKTENSGSSCPAIADFNVNAL